VHVLLVKLPPDVLAVHVTVPVGAWGAPALLSVTVTVRVVGVPAPTDALLGLMVVLVVLLLMVRVGEAELLACELSPE
jgi:hypothetical protein